MINAIGQLLPLMIAVALSTVPILVTVTVLLSPGSSTSRFFLTGWLLGLLAITGVFTLALQSFPPASARSSEPALGVAQIVIGFGLIAYGIFLLTRMRTAAPQTELPRWLRAVGTVRPITALGLAIVLNLRLKALLLSAAAALILGTSRLSVPETLIALAIFVGVGGSSVAVPIVLALANPEMRQRPLEATRQWIIRNNRAVTLVVVFIVATVILGDGMTHL